MLDEKRNSRVTPSDATSPGCDASAADNFPDDDAVEIADDKESAMVAVVEPLKTSRAVSAMILK